jgi:hypothetical protein
LLAKSDYFQNEFVAWQEKERRYAITAWDKVAIHPILVEPRKNRNSLNRLILLYEWHFDDPQQANIVPKLAPCNRGTQFFSR